MLKFDNDTGLPFMLMAEGDPTPGAGDAAAAAAAAAGAKPWYDGTGVTTEEIGYFQNRGLDKMTPAQAAVASARAHREAEKNLGVPADKIVRLPNDPADAEAWRQVRIKLGAPADEKGYDFSVIKHADGSDLSPEEKASWAKKSYSLGLRPADALSFVSETVKEQDTAANNSGKTEAEAKLANEKAELVKNWGPNFEPNMFVAKQAAAALKVKPEAIAALEKVVGYAAVMEMMRDIGSKIGEDKFVINHAPGGQGVMTREQAVERKAALMADKVWTTAYMNGDAEKGREMLALNTMIVNQK